MDALPDESIVIWQASGIVMVFAYAGMAVTAHTDDTAAASTRMEPRILYMVYLEKRRRHATRAQRKHRAID